MKSTIDLPSDLVREMKLRAVHEGRKLKDIAAELLQAALKPGTLTMNCPTAALPKTLPVLKATHPAAGGTVDAQEFGDFIKQADMDLDVTSHEKALGH